MSRVAVNDDGTVTVTLKHPIEKGKSTVTEISIRTECLVSDLEAMDSGKGDVEKTLKLISELSCISNMRPGISVDMLRLLRSSDYLILAKQAGKAINADSAEGE